MSHLSSPQGPIRSCWICTVLLLWNHIGDASSSHRDKKERDIKQREGLSSLCLPPHMSYGSYGLSASWRSALVKLSKKTFLGQQDSSEKKWKCVFKFSPLKGEVFISGAEASFVHLLYFVLIAAKRRRRGWRATCLLSSEEQGVHPANLVDCTLLDGFGILRF